MNPLDNGFKRQERYLFNQDPLKLIQPVDWNICNNLVNLNSTGFMQLLNQLVDGFFPSYSYRVLVRCGKVLLANRSFRDRKT
jgi:hypothetical protein